MDQKFANKTIGGVNTLGNILIQQRKKLGLDLREIAPKIKIHQKYLIALEEGNYKSLPAEIYSKNFLRKYLKILHLSEKEHIELFLEEKNSYNALNKVKKEKHFVQKVEKSNLLSVPKIIRGTIIFLLFISLVTYLTVEIKKITAPPYLTINYPPENMTTNRSSVLIEGQAEKEAQITINEQGVYSDEQGFFKKNIELQNGINIIKITAQRKQGKENNLYRTIMVEKQDENQ